MAFNSISDVPSVPGLKKIENCVVNSIRLSAWRKTENERQLYSLDIASTSYLGAEGRLGPQKLAVSFTSAASPFSPCSCHFSAFPPHCLFLSSALLGARGMVLNLQPSLPAGFEGVMATHATHSSANRRFNKIPSLSNSVFIKFPPHTHINSSSLPFRTDD